MNPIGMALLLTTGLGLFTVSIVRRFKLLFVAATRSTRVSGSWRARWQRTLQDGFLQTRVRREAGAGIAHTLIFFGFLVLLARTVTLFGRGFDRKFDLWILGIEPTFGMPLGTIYNFAKDVCSWLVLLAVGYFLLRRIWWKPGRLRLSSEGIVILVVIAALMITDQVYAGASPHSWLSHFGFWSHALLVLGFLNWLPYSKHFHIITALPNLYFAPVTPGGKLPAIAATAEELLEKADQLQSAPEKGLTPLGIGRIEDLSWKDRLDLFTCTECGRCSEHCPATRTEKPLSPMQLTLDLRSQLLASRQRLTESKGVSGVSASPGDETALIPHVISAETIWACTTCRACEEQCPVGIGYVEKIVSMRRDLVLMRGEVPPSLQRTFDGLERHGNPWQLARAQRTDWAKDLGVRRLANIARTRILYWVGCAASYDERAQRVARALVKLLQKAGVDFAILGDEETCTGDAARRAGNEYLFLQLAQKNVKTLNGYFHEGRFERIVTACPHCLTTLGNEYPDFGGTWPVIHHSQFLLELVQEGKLIPSAVSNLSVTLHDPCTLSRYADDLISTRQLLRKVPGTSIREPEHNRQFTLCCGAGGAHMWMDDPGPKRMNEARTQELLATGAEKLVTACPFCSTMLGDGQARLKAARSTEILDIAEVLGNACNGGQN